MAGSDTFDVSVQFWLNRTRPFDGPDGDTAPDDGWRGRGFNRFGSNKRGVVIAVCSRATVRYANGRASAPAGSAASARAACPTGMHVAGGGAGLSGSATEAFINTSFPYDSNDADRRPDDGWKARAFNQGGPEKVLTVHAACVRALPRYVLASSTSSVQAVAPMCPDRTYGMGGGGVVAGPADRAFVSGIAPFGPESSPPDGGFATLFSRTDAGARYTGVSVCKT
jgi:hypothetical protein